jgi:CPA2 family monovalent cation:H+ antiporter-2
MKRIVFGLGLVQVLARSLLVTVVGRLAAWAGGPALRSAARWRCRPPRSCPSCSSDRMELDSRHGRETIGVLLFQDIAVVPLLILLPALSRRPRSCCSPWAWRPLKAVVLLGCWCWSSGSA